MKNFKRSILLSCLTFVLPLTIFSQENIYWGDSLPGNWNGSWPGKYLTACEKSDFTYTAKNDDILDFFSLLQWNSDKVHIFDMFTSDLGRKCPVLVMSNPRVTNPATANESGKTIVYLQGGIHPDESEGKEALLILARDILLGDKSYLLDSLIIMICPNFNVDGNETRSVSGEIPYLRGNRRNACDLDINRDGIKVETVNMKGAYENVFNSWDPVLIYDTHRMGVVRHGYPIAYAGSNVPAASASPRNYVTYNLFPELTQGGRENGGIEIFYHCCLSRDEWPPAEFTHDNAYWTTEGKFMVSSYGLRNRMAVLVETSACISYEKMVYSHLVCAEELLDFCFKNGREMQNICNESDRQLMRDIKNLTPEGKLKNYVDGKYVSEGKYDILGFRNIEFEYIPGTSIRRVKPSCVNRKPDLINDVELVTKPVGIKEATVPRGYLLPEDMGFIVDKLRILGLDVRKLEEPINVSGEEYVINTISHEMKAGYNMTILEGSFTKFKSKTIPAGWFMLDMAQPLANVAFYALEPQVGDSFAGWNLLDNYMAEQGINKHQIIYPVIKYYSVAQK